MVKLEITKHFKFVSMLVLVVLAVIVLIGWNRGGTATQSSSSPTNERFPRQGQGQGQWGEQPGSGVHPNLEPNTGGKKPCSVCQQKKQQDGSRRIESFKIKPKPNQQFI